MRAGEAGEDEEEQVDGEGADEVRSAAAWLPQEMEHGGDRRPDLNSMRTLQNGKVPWLMGQIRSRRLWACLGLLHSIKISSASSNPL